MGCYQVALSFLVADKFYNEGTQMRFSKQLFSFLCMLMVASCGGEKSAVQPTIEQTSVAITGPETVEEGSRAIFKLINVTSSHDIKISQGYVLNSSNHSVEVVVPTIHGTDTAELEIAVYNGSELLVEHRTVIEPLAAPVITELPRPYPLESSRISKYDKVPRDERGIPMVNRDGTYFYYHVDLSKIAQVYYAYIRKHDRPAKETAEFIAMAEWLKDNCVYTEWGFCSWQAQFDISAYSLPSNWTSAMAQGQAITVLYYAYAVTQDESYIEVLSDAIAAFNYPVAEKGVVADFNGHRFYEEYGSEDKPAHVLNGFLFALTGLYEVAELAHSKAAKQAFEQGLETLGNTLHFYDLGFTSRYDYSHLNQIASTKGGVNGDLYHEIHLAQLAWLYQVSQDETVLDYLQRFLMYDTGGLTSFANLTAASTKITDVEVSSTLAPETHGQQYLTDSNWTWRRYWSSDEVPATIILSLNNGSPTDEKIILDGLRLTSVGEMSLPKEVSIYDCSGIQRKLVSQGLTRASAKSEYLYELNGYTSFTVVYDLKGTQLDCSQVEIELIPNEEQGYIALRELNVHLEQPYIIEQLLERYQNYAP